MKPQPFVIALFFGLFLALAGCGAGSEGDSCELNEDCNDDLICAGIAVCTDEPCPGICGKPCNTDADCPDGTCGENFGGERVCQNSRTIDFFTDGE